MFVDVCLSVPCVLFCFPFALNQGLDSQWEKAALTVIVEPALSSDESHLGTRHSVAHKRPLNQR